MHFLSIEFLYLVTATFLLYYVPGFRKAQVYILIVASLLFYGYGQPELLPLLIFVSVSAGVASLLVTSNRKPRFVVWVSVTLFLLVLCFFKYKFLPFFRIEELSEEFTGVLGYYLALSLPIGISFYTFQAISLVVDSTKEEYQPEIRKHASAYQRLKASFFYIVYFPQLVAGPIVKAHEFFPQISEKKIAEVPYWLAFRLCVTGLFFKSVVADNLNEYTLRMDMMADTGTGNFVDGITLIFAYSFQIYSDFFGYTLIAIGVAHLFGYRLPENFKSPYFSVSIAEFWRRWHISLSSFLREYLYFPLGGNRKGECRMYANLIIVMGLGGLWHGAALSYLFWGLYHGVGLVLERPLLKMSFFQSEKMTATVMRGFLVFLFVTFGWIFFKFPDFDQVSAYMKSFFITELNHGLLKTVDIVIISLLAATVVVQHILSRVPVRNDWVKTIGYASMIFLIIHQRGGADAFIYFQF